MTWRACPVLPCCVFLVFSTLTFTVAYGSAASNTIKAAPISIKAGDKVTFTGRTKGIPMGSKLVLQHKQGVMWTTLQASTTVHQGSSYSLDAKLNDKGMQDFRIKYDDVMSPAVTVNVT